MVVFEITQYVGDNPVSKITKCNNFSSMSSLRRVIHVVGLLEEEKTSICFQWTRTHDLSVHSPALRPLGHQQTPCWATFFWHIFMLLCSVAICTATILTFGGFLCSCPFRQTKNCPSLTSVSYMMLEWKILYIMKNWNIWMKSKLNVLILCSEVFCSYIHTCLVNSCILNKDKHILCTLL